MNINISKTASTIKTVFVDEWEVQQPWPKVFRVLLWIGQLLSLHIESLEIILTVPLTLETFEFQNPMEPSVISLR